MSTTLAILLIVVTLLMVLAARPGGACAEYPKKWCETKKVFRKAKSESEKGWHEIEKGWDELTGQKVQDTTRGPRHPLAPQNGHRTVHLAVPPPAGGFIR